MGQLLYIAGSLGGWVFVVAPLLALAAGVHVVRTGRPLYWIWLILIFPFMGPLIYFIAEVAPYSSFRVPANPIPWLLDRLIPGHELARLTEALERSPTVVNRQALAAYHERQGDLDAATAELTRCLTGIYKDDPGLKHDLAEVRFRAGDWKTAETLMEATRAEAPRHEPQRRDFLLARVLEERGEKEAAIAAYEKLREAGPITEEARVRLGMLVEERGDKARAKELYKEVVRRMKTANNTYRRDQRAWLKLAREKLKQA